MNANGNGKDDTSQSAKSLFASLAFAPAAMGNVLLAALAKTLASLQNSLGVSTTDASYSRSELPVKCDVSISSLDETINHEKRRDPNMSDQDLSGENLKYVNYSILFTKRDHEVTLRECTDDLVDYSTDGSSYAALQIGKFIEDASNGRTTEARQRLETKEYDDIEDLPNGWTIPDRDRRYIRFVFHVKQRLEKESAEYEKRQTKALERISKKIV